jgi:hypothetical protein
MPARPRVKLAVNGIAVTVEFSIVRFTTSEFDPRVELPVPIPEPQKPQVPSARLLPLTFAFEIRTSQIRAFT